MGHSVEKAFVGLHLRSPPDACNTARPQSRLSPSTLAFAAHVRSWTNTLTNTPTNERTSQLKRRIAISPGRGTQDNLYGAVIMLRALREFTRFMRW